MRFTATADTDVGRRKNNQDSALIKHARYSGGEVLLAVVCDGMGGLASGELASATVIRAFADWFDRELPIELVEPDMEVIGRKWELLLKTLNVKIAEYTGGTNARMGTTFSGILFIDDKLLIGHVGDSRIYYVDRQLYQLTEDHTYVAYQIKRGVLTPEQAKTDPMRNYLLQCVGASPSVTPQIIVGKAKPGTYLLCSDGFRHEVTEKEMFSALAPKQLPDKAAMHTTIRSLTQLVQQRGETDNVTAVLIKAE